MYLSYGFKMAKVFMIAWLEPSYPNWRRIEDVNHVGENLLSLWSFKYYRDIYYRSMPKNFAN